MPDEWLMKICSVGSYRVGKTSIIRRYAENKFSSNYLPTLGVDVTVKRLEVDNQRVRLVLMDTAGQEQFGRLRKIYYEGSAGCIAVYSVIDEKSFESLDRWVADYREVAGEGARIIIVGNKIDLKDLRVVSTGEGQKFAQKQGFPFHECSAKLGGEIINKIFIELIRQYFASIKESQ
ncbi:MAG: Rab family GTPase [Candidatus Hermodarchaeota archaeon]